MKTHNPISVILALLTALPPTGLAIPTYGPLGYAFRLQTHVTRGADYFEGLFVSSFHTGAGQSDLVATKNRTLAPKWLITANATLQRDRGPGAGSAASFDWHAVLTPSLGYEGWMPVTLQAGTEASKGFSLAPQDGTPPVLTWTANETEADASAVASTAVDEDTPRAQGPVTWLGKRASPRTWGRQETSGSLS